MQYKRIANGHMLVAFDGDQIDNNHYHLAPDGTILSVKEDGRHRYNRGNIRKRIIDVLGFEDWTPGWQPRRTTFSATCARCATRVDIPFQPDPSRSFFCKPCNSILREERERTKQQKDREREQRQKQQKEREQKQREWEQRQREREFTAQRRRSEWEQRQKERASRVLDAIRRLETSVKRDEESISRLFEKVRNLKPSRNYTQIYNDLHAKISSIERTKRDKNQKIANMWHDHQRINSETFRG